ncbi:MAG: transporter [Bacteroidota bacterium]
MKKLVLIALCMFLKTALFAQNDPGAIETDRPDQTETPSLVPPGYFQAEIGFQSEYDETDTILSNETVAFRNFLYPTALLKYGVLPWLELRFIAEFAEQRAFKNDVEIEARRGFNPIAIGTKIGLLQESGWQPKTSLIAHVQVPGVGAEAFKIDDPIVDFRFTMNHSLNYDMSLSYNLGGEINTAAEENPVWLYTLALGMQLDEQWGLFGESYGFYSDGTRAENLLDAGITYKLFKNLQFDVSAGLAVSDAAPDSFVSAGVSFRLPN